MGESHFTDPLYIVETQLNTLTAVGTATKKVRNEKMYLAQFDIPATKR
jgi:hypothetical protein